MTRKDALVIGNGSSVNFYEDYLEYSNYDIKIGTKFQFKQYNGLDYVAAADLKPTQLILKQNPEWNGKIITRQIWKEHLERSGEYQLITPKTHHKGDVTGTLAVKYAIELGATHITTVGMDSLAGEWLKNDVWPWLANNVDTQILKPQRMLEKRKQLLHTWGDQLIYIKEKNPHILFRHYHIGNKLEFPNIDFE